MVVGLMTSGEPVEQNDRCPMCGAAAFKPTSIRLDMRETLAKWEQTLKGPLGQTVWDDYAEYPEVTLFECGACGFGMFDPPAAGTANFYAAITRTEAEYYVPDRWEYRRAIQDIRKYGARRVLDVGGGSGHFLDLLQQELPGVEALVYEFNEEVADVARTKGLNVCHGEFPQAVYDVGGQAEFDAVCVFQVLEHVADPVTFLRDLVSLLKPDGILMLSVPDLTGPVRFHRLALMNTPPHHVSWWKPSVFSASMYHFGLRIVDSANENLPDYLWRGYLPVIVENHIRPPKLARLARKYHVFDVIIRVLKLLGFKEIPGLCGHTLYVLLQRSTI